ncbi:hypothetical protein [Fuscovulum blasticum]|uniref:hypothetical protein n=1 Tax=Fuscovulum blasticum TaxID=1075 RepID=UPI000D3E5FDC|nr:hypothetical protein [Fuscovulum blasticum]AWD21746.1 hypothetical protein B6K69_08710 [Fuscovulum blasticum]
MSAWWKVFLRNGLVWPPFILAQVFLLRQFQGPSGALELSDSMNQIVPVVVLPLVWFAMTGASMCVFRMMVQWVKSSAEQKGKKMPAMRWRWFWSYFLELDEEYRLRA